MLKQFIAFSYGSWVSAAISFFTTPIITLLIIPEEFGKSSMFTLALQFVTQIGLLGLDQSFMRMFYEKKEEKDRTRLAWICIILSVGTTFLVICFLLPFWSQISTVLFEESVFLSVLLLVICLFLSIIERFTTSVVRIKKKGNVFSIIRIINAVVNVVVVICYAKFIAPSFYAIVFGTLFSLTISIVISLITEIQFWKKRFEAVLFKQSEIKQIFYYGLPLVPVFIVTILFQSMDKMMLRAYSSFNEIGLYAAANKFIFPLTIIQSGFTMFWYPLALETYEKDNTNYVFFENMFKYMAALILISASAVLILKDIIVYLLAPSYRSSIHIMPFLILVPLMYILGDVTGLGIGFKKRTYLNFVFIIPAILINFIGNYLLIPLYGARGAAISTGIAYIFYFSLRTYISFRLFPARYPIVKYLPSFCFLLIFIFLNTFINIPFFVNIGLSVIIILLHRKIVFDFLQKGIKEIRGTSHDIHE